MKPVEIPDAEVPDYGLPAARVVYGANQPEYLPLPAVIYVSGEQRVLTRWELTDEERARVAAGANVELEQLTFGHPFQPVAMRVAP